MKNDLNNYHENLVKDLKSSLSGNKKKITIKKKTISNLFRYKDRKRSSTFQIDLSNFNKPLYLDKKNQTLEVEGLTTYEDIVDFTLPLGFLPTITPELKHITIGGAVVGIGIESNSYKYGFVHDSLIEAEVLLPDGRIVVCSADNKYSDLFYALPNSYGTLGYILKLKIKLRAVSKYVELKSKQFTDIKSFINGMNLAIKDKSIDYIESLLYSNKSMYLITGKETNKGNNIKTIYGNTIFYKEVSCNGKYIFPIRDYLFRYDPEWFWAIPQTSIYRFFRSIAPEKLRNSAFYSRYADFQRKISSKIPFIKFEDPNFELLIQDWEVPWSESSKILKYALDNLDLDGKPLMGVPIKAFGNASSYPMKSGEIYFNLGSYSYVKKKIIKTEFVSTKIMDEFCFDHNGIKMLYSSSFIDEKRFDEIYNGKLYKKIKRKYDPKSLTPTLFHKAVKGR